MPDGAAEQARSSSSCEPNTNLYPHLHDHTETAALWATTTSNGCRFVGLRESLRGLQGHRVLLWGDSTVYNLALGLQGLLGIEPGQMDRLMASNESYSGLVDTTLAKLWVRTERAVPFTRNGFNKWPTYPNMFCRNFTHSPDDSANADFATRTEVCYFDAQERHQKYTGSACHLESALARALNWVQPDVLIFNFGAHWFHTIGGGTFTPKPCVVHEFLRYEAWLTAMLDVAANAQVQTVVIKTTNRVCEDRFSLEQTRNWTRLARNGEEGLRLLAEPCISHFRRMNATDDIAPNQLADYCMNAPFAEHGSRHMNRMILAWLHRTKRNGAVPAGVRRLALFDDHALQSCKYAADSLHSRRLVWMRARALGHLFL